MSSDARHSAQHNVRHHVVRNLRHRSIRFVTLLVVMISGLAPSSSSAQFVVSGTVIEAADGEVLAGATIVLDGTTKGTTTNAYGFYSLTLNESAARLRISFVGFVTRYVDVELTDNRRLDVALEEEVFQVEDIVVTADRYELEEEILSPRMSLVKLSPSDVARIPTIGGESDLIKVAQLLPGVTRGNEGTTGMYVRGGTNDQNLVLLDEATVYNIGHLFGFFSVFNTDAIKDIQLMTGGFPARYGGRLSSILDVRMDEGSDQRYKAEGGIGILTSRLTIDGPISDKASFMLAGRRTYIDRVFRLAGTDLPYYFYDLNGKVNYKLTDRDRVFVSAYFGNDVLAVSESADPDSTVDEDALEGDLGFGFKLGNFTSTVRWNHIYENQKLFSNVVLHQTGFKYDISGDFAENEVLIQSRIQDVGVQADWEYFRSPANKLFFGMAFLHHGFRPNVVSTAGDITEFLASQKGQLLQTSEWAVYGGSERSLSDALQLNYGLRFSLARTESTTYAGPEPRLSLRYRVAENGSVKASYSLMRQYMHRVSSSAIALPTDLWYPVTDKVRPQLSNLVSAGYTHVVPIVGVSIAVEGYYKTLSNIIEYREGASLILNDNFEGELLAGSGRSYGAELLLRKRTGGWTGWVSYTLSKSDRLFDELNGGIRFPAKYDRTHSLSVVSMVDLNARVTFSAVWVYSSGARFTAQTGQFLMPNASLTDVELVPIYSDRNSVELAPTHRLDINFIVRSKERARFSGEWHFGAYNFYNKASPYRVSIRYNGVAYQYAQSGLFGFIPSVAYNFKFTR